MFLREGRDGDPAHQQIPRNDRLGKAGMDISNIATLLEIKRPPGYSRKTILLLVVLADHGEAIRAPEIVLIVAPDRFLYWLRQKDSTGSLSASKALDRGPVPQTYLSFRRLRACGNPAKPPPEGLAGISWLCPRPKMEG